MQTLTKPLPAPLPATGEDWDALRDHKISLTLNDKVEVIHNRLRENDKYARYLYAVYDEQAEEGSLSADNVMAALMIRQAAKKENGEEEVASQKLATINKALGVVLRRYHLSRKERRNTIGGEIIPENGTE